MAVALSILGILCLGYYISLSFFGMDFSVVWLLAGGVLVLLGYTLGWTRLWSDVLPKGVKVGICVVFLAGIFFFAFLEGLVISGMKGQPQNDLDYIIVLGAQVRGDHPSRALRKRIEKAAAYPKENPSTVAILSGGQGPGEDMTEADCMRQVLAEMGIDRERMILEDRSTSTWENLDLCAKLAPVKEKRVGLVTQNFHVYRSLKLAEHQGYGQVCGIPAPSQWSYQPHFMVREAFAIVKEKLVGNI